MVAVLRLEGLPFKATVDEIDDFFSESDIRVENVHLLLNRDMRPSGTGFVELSESDTKTALQLSGKCIGDTRRYVKIVKSDTDELEWHLRRQQRREANRKRRSGPLAFPGRTLRRRLAPCDCSRPLPYGP